MKVEHGGKKRRNSCFVSKGGGKRETENTKSETPFPISHEEIQTFVVTREDAFILVFL